MIKIYQETPLTTTFFCKLRDKTFSLRLFKSKHWKIIHQLTKLKDNEMFFENFAKVCFESREFTPKGVYSEFDFMKTLGIKIL